MFVFFSAIAYCNISRKIRVKEFDILQVCTYDLYVNTKQRNEEQVDASRSRWVSKNLGEISFYAFGFFVVYCQGQGS